MEARKAKALAAIRATVEERGYDTSAVTDDELFERIAQASRHFGKIGASLSAFSHLASAPGISAADFAERLRPR